MLFGNFPEQVSFEWTTEPPHKSGWYWVFRKDATGPTMVEIYNIGGVVQTANEFLGVKNPFFKDAKWLGPLPEPLTE